MKKFLKSLIMLLKSKSLTNKELYAIFWEDTSANTSWSNPDDVTEYLPALCLSVGYIWYSDPTKTIVVSDLGFDQSDDKIVLNEIGSVTTIPTKNIMKKIDLNFTKILN